MSGIKILIFLVCLFHLCFAKFDALDYQLCTEFTFRERTINGFHRFREAFKINFKDFEEKGGLESGEYTRFKAMHKEYFNYSESRYFERHEPEKPSWKNETALFTLMDFEKKSSQLRSYERNELNDQIRLEKEKYHRGVI